MKWDIWIKSRTQVESLTVSVADMTKVTFNLFNWFERRTSHAFNSHTEFSTCEIWRLNRAFKHVYSIVVIASAVCGSHIETSPNHFKVVDCYFFGTGSPWSCLPTPKRGNSYLNEICALYIVQVKCTCSLAVQDIERFKLHRIKLLCLKFYFYHNHQWNLIWFKFKLEGLKIKFQTVNESC